MNIQKVVKKIAVTIFIMLFLVGCGNSTSTPAAETSIETPVPTEDLTSKIEEGIETLGQTCEKFRDTPVSEAEGFATGTLQVMTISELGSDLYNVETFDVEGYATSPADEIETLACIYVEGVVVERCEYTIEGGFTLTKIRRAIHKDVLLINLKDETVMRKIDFKGGQPAQCPDVIDVKENENSLPPEVGTYATAEDIFQWVQENWAYLPTDEPAPTRTPEFVTVQMGDEIIVGDLAVTVLSMELIPSSSSLPSDRIYLGVEVTITNNGSADQTFYQDFVAVVDFEDSETALNQGLQAKNEIDEEKRLPETIPVGESVSGFLGFQILPDVTNVEFLVVDFETEELGAVFLAENLDEVIAAGDE